MSTTPENDYERAAGKHASRSIVSEFWYFMKQHKQWWLLPIFTALLLLGLVMALSSSGAAPFIYTLF